ncbi:MAG: hypothetical protein AAF512_22235, partial [Pseudomonadota bacterium]
LLDRPATLGINIIDNDACSSGNRGFALDANGQQKNTQICFANMLDGTETPVPFLLNQVDNHTTTIQIEADPVDQGQPAKILLLGGCRASGIAEFSFFKKHADIG